ncbi:hypothetical protein DLAC_09204 [Tieghemostelium lacteum]|uniref:Uncharacterized protein n=1 Tax=Tieghemostelium lacteum TaxID=361077 RepID=A0A151Z9M9_TIELA|nr:hypothetical protein DLAC_09204 [Tieghemostelium lacteum]|eukprot:KYQ90574.1 hypothetical protein DLAC_09204 [Tieghemostelium lacteum]
MGIYSYIGDNDMGWVKKKGADSHAKPRPEKQTKMKLIDDVNTTQFLKTPKEALNLKLDGDIKKGGNKTGNINVGGGR